MAAEGLEQVGEGTGGAPPPAGAAKPGGEQQVGDKPAGGPGAQPEKSRDYDREIAGFKADLAKERKARQQYEADLKTERANVEAERKRVAIALGVNPQTDEEKDNELIQQQFAKRFPHLAGLTQEDIDAIRALKGQASALQQTTTHYWEAQGERMVQAVGAEIAKELGSELTPRQMKRIAVLYGEEAESNPEFLLRHSRGDQKLAAEFAAQIIEDWFEPARRKVTQTEVQRLRPVPNGKDRGIITHGEQKIDVNDPKAVEDVLVRGFRERGGQFGRR